MSETLLSYWREDPLLNEHHEHWHLVYPYVGRVDEDLHTEEELERIFRNETQARYRLWNDRHGELFVYMHSQLLARYAAERLSVGLPAVVPFENYRRPIANGYIADIVLKLGNELVRPGIRSDNTSLRDLTNAKFSTRPGAKIEAQERFRDRLKAAVSSATASNYPSSITELGERIEPTDRFATQYFGALHNDGHLLISMHDDDPLRPGCMFWEEAAVRDPIFYEWHKHIDNLFRRYQETLPCHDFSGLPAVELTNFMVADASGRHNQLTTEMRSRSLRSQRFSNITMVKFLSHEDFSYEFEVVNKNSKCIDVTARVFVAPEETSNQAESWIEMDKFRVTLPLDKTTVRRESKNSSVVRHPLWTANMLEKPETGPDESGASPGCRCGWPYTLLLPRGKPEGMRFIFALLLTPGTDVSAVLLQNNSSSYCGLVDSKYPDVKPMGYPFDRPNARPIRDWLLGNARPPQVISTLVTITHRTTPQRAA